jgi:hypothetical protein
MRGPMVTDYRFVIAPLPAIEDNGWKQLSHFLEEHVQVTLPYKLRNPCGSLLLVVLRLLRGCGHPVSPSHNYFGFRHDGRSCLAVTTLLQSESTQTMPQIN